MYSINHHIIRFTWSHSNAHEQIKFTRQLPQLCKFILLKRHYFVKYLGPCYLHSNLTLPVFFTSVKVFFSTENLGFYWTWSMNNYHGHSSRECHFTNKYQFFAHKQNNSFCVHPMWIKSSPSCLWGSDAHVKQSHRIYSTPKLRDRAVSLGRRGAFEGVGGVLKVHMQMI